MERVALIDTVCRYRMLEEKMDDFKKNTMEQISTNDRQETKNKKPKKKKMKKKRIKNEKQKNKKKQKKKKKKKKTKK